VEIIALVKQVPATESFIGIAPDGVSIKTDEVKWVMNPYDEFAVEEALRIREAKGGTVTIVSVGTDRAVETIRTALAMGADKGLLIRDSGAEACDGLGIARILAAAIRTLPAPDLVIAGQRAVVDDNYLVGPAVAEYLDLPHISMVTKIEIGEGKIRCQKTIDGGTAVLEAPTPALFTTQRGLNEPRYASLPGIMKAKKKPLDIKTLADIGLDSGKAGKPVIRTEALHLPPERKGGRIIEGGSAGEKATELVRLLHEEAKVI
jgi:electron transfer flavoprotein beta subunit